MRPEHSKIKAKAETRECKTKTETETETNMVNSIARESKTNGHALLFVTYLK